MKKSLVFALALMLVLAFASSAMAAQALVNGSYLSTTATGMDTRTGSSAGSAFSRVYQENKFTVDGVTNYPYEIYLPNEASPSSYRIHSNYAKNTDACASCHATHTAVGASLLQWYSVYETCMACHDGTLGSATYNVEGGTIGATTAPAFGGMFGNGTQASLSNHNVTGSMEIAAAPGGSTVATKFDPKDPTRPLNWTIEFGCQSCHSPHGQGGNARILHPDANYAASSAAEARTVAKKYFVSTSGAVYSDAGFTQEVYIIKGYPYAPVIIDGNVADTTGMKISNLSGTSIVVQADGTTPVVSGTVYVLNGVASLKVKMNISGYLTAGESVTHVYGMNFYCGACHTDYNTAAFKANGSGQEETGVFAQAHRHQMGMDWYHETKGLKFEAPIKPQFGAKGTMECLTCHVAHGTSETYWDATLMQAGQAWAGETLSLTELAGSSALKRMPNMGTCEACHAKGEGAEGYNANAGFLGSTPAPGVVNGLMPNTYGFAAQFADYAATDRDWVGSAKCVGCHEEYVDGWKATSHKTSSHTGAASCGRCHNPGNTIIGNATGLGALLNVTATSTVDANAYLLNPAISTWGSVYEKGANPPRTVIGSDAGITCEACHGSGARHILAPTSKNIFNPGSASIERQAIECGKCHDVFANNTLWPDATLGTVSGVTYTGIVNGKNPSISKLADLVGLPNWSVAYRAYQQDPAKFADANEINATSNHFGGAWGYADSKHFIGTGGTPTAPNGVVSCNTCHDMHSDKQAGLLKYQYSQICSSCHDASADLAIAVAMPTNNWNRHQIEANDFAHSFKFGTAASVKAVDIFNVNLESASADRQCYVGDTYHSLWASGNESTSKLLSAGYTNTNLWRSSQTGGAGIGKKVVAYSDAGKTTRVYNNYEITWTYDDAASTNNAVFGTDFVMVPEGGALEFTNPYDGMGTIVPGDYAKFNGTYVMHYVVNSNPALNGDITFTINN